MTDELNHCLIYSMNSTGFYSQHVAGCWAPPVFTPSQRAVCEAEEVNVVFLVVGDGLNTWIVALAYGGEMEVVPQCA